MDFGQLFAKYFLFVRGVWPIFSIFASIRALFRGPFFEFYIYKFMLIYNTTFHVEMEDARNFVIWLNEYYIPEVEKSEKLKNPRILRILSHQEQNSECFSLQWEVENSATLHHWHTEQGASLNEEMMKVFKDKVIGFPTLMEVVR